ncbi:MAG: DsbA family protein [Sphingomonadaceae bacterium]|uniref:DsbA family protein n=1 Tax=Thermaurantiacus sp. TaxID=2820283 RepID=UPI00298EEE17|nr:DsbA family protein [Thermaurantiacus sp.]MCS6986516.1 DsbA family protein [Sphingomonadaceae bacterium]MDW8414223.1 DsbA family protein [Thermaurantiacus sp.]
MNRWAAVALALVVGAVLGAVLWPMVGPRPVSEPDRARIEAIVRETLLAYPELVPEAINRLQQREVAKLLASNRAAIETPFAGAWAGARDADVTLVEFFDFQCPYCRQGRTDVARLLAEDDRLRVVWRDFPVLGPVSERFALASLSAARQGRYRAFLDAVFAGSGRLDETRLIAAVRAAGLDERQVAQDLKSPELRRELESNLALGRALGLTGTPSYVVGDRIVSGAVGYEALRRAVADARARRTAPPARPTASRPVLR